jgi:molybdate transport system substrate-binding protein
MSSAMRRFVLAALIAVTLAGCGSSKPSAGSSSAIHGTITVYAASSLTGVFTTLGQQFQAAHPGTTVRFSFAGSNTLAQQIVNGAPADVFAAASPAMMKIVTDANLASGPPTTFVKNHLVIAVQPGNPKHISSLADLAKPGVEVAMCAPTVPCGAAATKALAAGHISIKPVTLETDVKEALSKVELGEVDAALVYRTDAKSAAGKVAGVEFRESAQAINSYPIAALTGGANETGGAAFVAFVLTDQSRTVFTDAGFASP